MDFDVFQIAKLTPLFGGIDIYSVYNQEIKSLKAKSKGTPGWFGRKDQEFTPRPQSIIPVAVAIFVGS